MKRRIALITASVLILASVSLAFATTLEYSGSHVFRNEFNTSGVNLKLEQFQMKDGIMAPANCGSDVMPGEKLSYIPRVTNLEADSYIRVSFEISADETGMAITPDSFFGVGENWIRKGNCFYCRNIFGKDESADVIRGIVVPSGIKKAGGKIRIRATADAIQAKNFAPDFTEANPWGTVEIQTRDFREDGSGAVCRGAIKTQSMDFSFAREGTFECSTEDLFSQFGSFQPGDRYSETLDMKNNSGRRLTVNFRTDNLKTDLLDEMKLSISCCGKNVYNGPLTSETLSTFLEIGTIEDGQAGKLEFEISMPKEADNRYSMLEDNVTWIIAVSDSDGEDVTETAATGDMWLPVAMAILGISAALLAAVITILSRKGKDRGND